MTLQHEGVLLKVIRQNSICIITYLRALLATDGWVGNPVQGHLE